jgi:aspartyl protease family protein
VNGAPVRFIIDTGASDIVLSPSDARRAGVDMASLDFARGYETANGAGRGARVVLKSLQVGQVHAADVEASVNAAPMRASLLGMAFLKRFESIEVRGGRLVLRWRG